MLYDEFKTINCVYCYSMHCDHYLFVHIPTDGQMGAETSVCAYRKQSFASALKIDAGQIKNDRTYRLMDIFP